MALANSYEEFGEYQLAIEQHQNIILNKILNNDDERALSYQIIAKLYRKMKDYKNAKINYDQAIAADLIKPLYNGGNLYFECATMLRDDVQNYTESEKYYLNLLERNSRFSRCNGAYGYLLYLMGKYDEAMKYIEVELEVSRFHWAYIYRALVNYKKGLHLFVKDDMLKGVKKIKLNTVHERSLERIQSMKRRDADTEEFYDRLMELMSSK